MAAYVSRSLLVCVLHCSEVHTRFHLYKVVIREVYTHRHTTTANSAQDVDVQS